MVPVEECCLPVVVLVKSLDTDEITQLGSVCIRAG